MTGPAGDAAVQVGKTTTLEILEGFRAPSAGRVRVLGINPAAQPVRLRERVGMVLQECGFPRQARVAELIGLWRTYYPDPRPLGELLDVVELTEVRNTQVRKLSGGQRRRLDFALALAGDPDLIFLDAMLGLAISSVITSAESAGPVAYASFLPIAIISGVFDPTFSGLPDWLSRLVAAFPVKSLAEVLQNTYAVRPFPAWDLFNLGLWTAAGTAFALWRFRWHN